MEIEVGLVEHRNLRRLRIDWAGWVSASLLLLAVFYLILRQGWGISYAGRWLLLVSGIAVYQFVFLWQNLDKNRVDAGAPLLPTLGIANLITLFRGFLNAALAGFLLGPWPPGWLAWAPAALYLTSSLMDFADGAAARISGRVTILGDTLDMKWDGAGMFLAATLAVLYGQAPVVFLLVAFARYLYLFGIWQRKRQGLPVYDLLPSRIRRPFAGMMMGFVAVILMPVYAPPPTHIAAVLFMIPFLGQFLYDWRTASGHNRLPVASDESGTSIWRRRAHAAIPLAARTILIILLFDLLFFQIRQVAPPAIGMFLVTSLALVSFSFGAAGRLFSLAVLLMSGFGLQQAPSQWRYWLILLFSVILMMVGTGRFSIWKPEDWLLYKRLGDPPSIPRAQQ